MNNLLWGKYKFRIIPSLLLTILYLVVIGLGWFASWGTGEDLAFLVIYLNLPFYILFWVISGGRDLANYPITEGFIIFVGSPMMYGLLGWIIGWAFEKIAIVPQSSREYGSLNNEGEKSKHPR